MRELKADNPTPVNVQGMIPEGTAGASIAKIAAVTTVQLALSTTGGTADAGYASWVNPESGTILVTDVGVRFTTTGTGTFDVGTSDDGTGANDGVMNGATMNSPVGAGVLSAVKLNLAGSAGTIGVLQGWLLGPGGTGVNNSIVAKTTETATTAVGAMFITYYPLI
jgi:hypothetical protein